VDLKTARLAIIKLRAQKAELAAKVAELQAAQKPKKKTPAVPTIQSELARVEKKFNAIAKPKVKAPVKKEK